MPITRTIDSLLSTAKTGGAASLAASSCSDALAASRPWRRDGSALETGLASFSVAPFSCVWLNFVRSVGAGLIAAGSLEIAFDVVASTRDASAGNWLKGFGVVCAWNGTTGFGSGKVASGVVTAATRSFAIGSLAVASVIFRAVV